MNFLYTPRRRKTYSVDKLRVAYADLLEHIGVSNDEIGRRGIDEEDVNIQKRFKRFSFRRNVIPTTTVTSPTASTSTVGVTAGDETRRELDSNRGDSVRTAQRDTNLLGEARDDDGGSSSLINKEHRELAAAFRMIAATRSPDKEGDNFGAAAIRDDSYVSAISSAKAIESRVVELIRTIGDIVIQSDRSKNGADTPRSPRNNSSPQQVRSDPVFEYFCEKSMLSLLVDIAKEKRQGLEEGRRWGISSCYHGVVWSPLVKAQVFSTVAQLVGDCNDRSVLYYLLSHNYVNELIQCMLPLQQWTDQAQSKMIPTYVEMLQKVAVQLAEDPYLFPFLTMDTVPTSERDREGSNETAEGPYEIRTTFPLYSAALDTATSSFAESDSVAYGTCLIVAVNIMQISHPPIQTWVCNAGPEQRRLADHLCQRLLDRYFRIVNLTTGPIVDGVRSNAIANQLAGLKDHMAMIHEVFWSGVRGLDVRLCESLLQRVVTILLRNLGTHRRRAFLSGVGLVDADVIPEQEASAQVSTIFFSLLFSTLAYDPFQRMLAVALLHEKSTPLWTSSMKWMQNIDSSEGYVFMPLLSDIVTGDQERETCPNIFRAEIIKGVSGQYGDWRTSACACLLQTALESEAMDDNSLSLLKVVPAPDNDDLSIYEPTALEEAIATFLMRAHMPSHVTVQSLQYVGHLAVQVICKILLRFTRNAEDIESRIQFVVARSPVWKALLHAKSRFADEAQKCQGMTGVSDIFLDLVESSIQSRYIARYNQIGEPSYRCPLGQRGRAFDRMDSEILVRKLRGVSPNDVETSRFFLNMTLHFRALCKVVDRFCSSVRKQAKASSSAGKSDFAIELDLVDKADELTRIVGGLSDKPKSGSNLDLTGRMTFRFKSAIKPNDAGQGAESPSRLRSFSEDMGVFRSTSNLMLVLDPRYMFVVRPMQPSVDKNRATVLCSIFLRSVIAAADDGEWLHIAVRHEDVGFLIKNGNMAVRLENSGSCLIIKQYLDRSREMLRQELLGKVSILLTEASASKVLENRQVEEKKSSS